ncbi:unnamed protein product [Linum tenue]|uniref:K-box domain-containing protein n=1 Tax=Linum tenue TaxID=586396 RepID=A0AAV0I148_9ROSI|nr:unnamed protein product [Linum tenue]
MSSQFFATLRLPSSSSPTAESSMSSAAPPIIKTIEKYQRYTYGQLESSHPSNDSEDHYREYLQLKATVESLQRSQRHILGEELVSLGTKELEQLENNLDESLKLIRLKKNQSIADQLSELKMKEEMLEETNRALRIKLQETDAVLPSSAWEAGEQSGLPPHQQQESTEPHCRNNPLQMSCGGPMEIGDRPSAVASSSGNVNGLMSRPGWMI